MRHCVAPLIALRYIYIYSDNIHFNNNHKMRMQAGIADFIVSRNIPLGVRCDFCGRYLNVVGVIDFRCK